MAASLPPRVRLEELPTELMENIASNVDKDSLHA
jgi:hypothetical protein